MFRRVCICLFLLMAGPSFAADATGNFMMGGGVGAVKCPEFLNAMSSARQAGGINTPSGVKIVGDFGMYVLGFETGFNMESDGIYDIFSTLDEPGFSALYAIERWCQEHPDKNFSSGLVALAIQLRETSEKK